MFLKQLKEPKTPTRRTFLVFTVFFLPKGTLWKPLMMPYQHTKKHKMALVGVFYLVCCYGIDLGANIVMSKAQPIRAQYLEDLDQ